MNIKQHSSGCIRHISYMQFALCKFPYKPRIDGTKCQLSLVCKLSSVLNIIEYPSYFRCRKISIDNQTCFFKYSATLTIVLHLVTKISRSSVLPDDCIINRLACLPVPYNGCLTLVRNTDSNYVFTFQSGHGNCLERYSGLS